MRHFVQALVLIVGMAVAIAALEAERRQPTVVNCYDISTANPTICE